MRERGTFGERCEANVLGCGAGAVCNEKEVDEVRRRSALAEDRADMVFGLGARCSNSVICIYTL